MYFLFSIVVFVVRVSSQLNLFVVLLFDWAFFSVKNSLILLISTVSILTVSILTVSILTVSILCQLINYIHKNKVIMNYYQFYSLCFLIISLLNKGIVTIFWYKKLVHTRNMGSNMETQKHLKFMEKRMDIDQCVNNWRMILTEEEIQLAVKHCADTINKKFVGKKIVIVCILKGAVYFFVDLTRMLKIPYSCYFIEASSYHNKQTQSTTLTIEGSIEPSKFYDRHVILIDELFDNGHTIEQVKTAIHQKANVPIDMIYTCTLFKKNKDVIITNEKQPDLYGIIVPNVWLVGYGLDDRQEKRGWTYLYACPKCDGIEKSTDDDIFTDENAYKTMRTNLLSHLGFDNTFGI
ncbi:phosphoribosyl transferase domain protein [Tupanvirus soda lake]|uniref:Phosphoribosyl transferase domain protein n=2 Tax=Tupanvirus TaxID=2094720 RepID=A0A6N1NND5_9VIRU|nr:phosphoribosyl transferase domain protein [Tupanvirus soda lake]QKU35805.1 phosphoribosyl transferase domain protein [Tupanvirus soda lake]